MTQKTAAKKWFTRVLGTTVAAGAMLAITALPASAGTTATSWGATPEAAALNAAKFCVNTLHGKVGGGVGSVEQDGNRWRATIPCNY